MEETPTGTPVGVDDPYAHAGPCDHLTDDGRCRFAVERADRAPGFAARRRADGLRCPAADPAGDWAFRDCPQFRSTTGAGECARCGLTERRDAHGDARPLVEAHHLVYPDAPGGDGDGDGAVAGEKPDAGVTHEVTVALCRWCHAKVHDSWARIDDDTAPVPAAIAAREGRRSAELDELSFETAADRRE